MNELYEKELRELKERMEKAEAFAKRFPLFKDYILKNKITGLGNSDYMNFGKQYKKLYFDWNINFGKYDKKSRRTITNYQDEYSEKWLFNIYFNTLSLYNSNEKYGLEELAKEEYVFFFDEWNSTFYIEEQHIEQFLEAANKWYINAVEKSRKDELEAKKIELEKQLKELEKGSEE